MERRSILWIEDDYYSLRGLVKPLQKAGFDVVPAYSMEDAKARLLAGEEFSCIILDIIIPVADTEPESDGDTRVDEDESLIKNGRAMLSYLRSDMMLSCPILVLTVVERSDILAMLQDAGADRCLVKGGLLPRDVKEAVLSMLDVAEGRND